MTIKSSVTISVNGDMKSFLDLLYKYDFDLPRLNRNQARHNKKNIIRTIIQKQKIK